MEELFRHVSEDSKVKIIYLCKDKPWYGLSYDSVVDKRFLGSRKGFLSFVLLTCRLVAELLRYKPSVAVIGLGSGGWTMWVVCLCVVLGIRAVVMASAVPPDMKPKRRMRRILWKVGVSLMLRLASLVLVPGYCGLRWGRCVRAPRQKIRAIPYSTVTKFWLVRGAPMVRKSFPSKPFKVLTVARLVGAKGLEAAVLAIAILGPDYQYIVVGDGPLKNKLRNIARAAGANVLFAGRVPWTELGKFYAEAHLFLLPSIVDPWGEVVHQAALFGLPMVLSKNVCAAYDITVPGKSAYIIPPGSSHKIAAAIRSMLTPANYLIASSTIVRAALSRDERLCAKHLLQALRSLFRHYRRRDQ